MFISFRFSFYLILLFDHFVSTHKSNFIIVSSIHTIGGMTSLCFSILRAIYMYAKHSVNYFLIHSRQKVANFIRDHNRIRFFFRYYFNDMRNNLLKSILYTQKAQIKRKAFFVFSLEKPRIKIKDAAVPSLHISAISTNVHKPLCTKTFTQQKGKY